MDLYDRQGAPISMERFTELLSQASNYRRVAETQVGPFWVSTVWLGLDHSFGSGPPLIFETMVFAGDHDLGDGRERDCRRYTTEAEALEGHAATVLLLQATTM